jgi:hypothetical protein
MLQGDEKDQPEERKTTPCAACGRPVVPGGRTEVWGYLLCGGETQTYSGCMGELCAVMPFSDEKAFTQRWVAEQRKARAA